PSVEEICAGYHDVVNRLHKRGIKVIGATLTPSKGVRNDSYSTPELNTQREAVNRFIRTSGIYDGVVDFEKVVLDSVTGMLRAEFVSGTGGNKDYIHPNRAGYQAMANAIDLKLIAPTIRSARSR